MRLHPPQMTSIGVLALVLAAATFAGVASATTEPADPASSAGGDPSAPGCAEVTALLDSEDALANAFWTEDGEAFAAAIAVIPDQVTAAAAAAPPEIADALAVLEAEVPVILGGLEGVELTDLEAVVGAMSSVPPNPESDAADDEIREWAESTCAWESSAIDPFADSVEPQECEILDPAVAATAAGLDVDVADSDGGGDINLGGYWTKSCSYGNGAMSLSTISFNSIDQATQFFVDTIGEGEFLDVNLGSLPASTLVTVQSGLIAVTVLEATVPFSVGFNADEVTPEAAVAAAEAVFAVLPTEVPPPPMSSEAP